jgi:FkbM family methyltransferase
MRAAGWIKGLCCVRVRLQVKHVMPSFSRGARVAVNSGLRRFGYSPRWVPPRALSQPARLIEVNFQMLAAHLMLTMKEPYFVGIGANDGVTHDPLYPFIRDFGWRGVMVEPVLEAFAALERNYAGFDGVTLVRAAIADSDGEGTIYTVDGADASSATMSLHSSFSREMLLRGRQWHPDLESRVVERKVPLMSFRTLLAKTDGLQIGVLKIDTEGYDLEILRTVDLAAVAPRLILAEHANLTRQDTIEMADILLDHGYQVSMTPLDMLGYKDLRP